MMPIQVTIVGEVYLPRVEQIQILQVESVRHVTPATDVIVLSPAQPELLEQQIKTIRSTPSIAFLPVYLCDQKHPLSDGVWILEETLLACEEIRSRRQALFVSEQIDEMTALLHYLWLRPNAKVVPERDWRSSLMYRYPLLEAFCGTEELACLLLNRMRSGQLLVSEKIVDRVPLCPKCHTGHLIFRETCPACHSINIEQSKTIHCFVCGHVGLESNFRRVGEMVCPNCSQTLRHIGSDYDRPLENTVCHDCGEMFIDPDSAAHCAQCGEISSSDKLQTEDFAIWHLSDEGRQICYHGQSSHLGSVLDTLDLIRPEYFEFALRWQINYAKRYSDSPFALVMVDITNLDILIRNVTMGQVVVHLNAFIEHLSRLVRTTDLMMRSNETRLWIILPHTLPAGLQAFENKLALWVQKTQEDSETKLDVRWYSYCSQQDEPITDTQELMAHLVEQIPENKK